MIKSLHYTHGVAVDMDIHGYIHRYIHGYIYVWISDLGHPVDISMDTTYM